MSGLCAGLTCTANMQWFSYVGYPVAHRPLVPLVVLFMLFPPPFISPNFRCVTSANAWYSLVGSCMNLEWVGLCMHPGFRRVYTPNIYILSHGTMLTPGEPHLGPHIPLWQLLPHCTAFPDSGVFGCNLQVSAKHQPLPEWRALLTLYVGKILLQAQATMAVTWPAGQRRAKRSSDFTLLCNAPMFIVPIFS